MKTGNIVRAAGRRLRDRVIAMFPLPMYSESGLSLWLRDESDRNVYQEIFVKRVYPLDAFRAELGGADAPVVFDVGANTGQFAAAVFDRWPRAHIHAFEPHRGLVRRIERFAAENRLQDLMQIQWTAIGERNGAQDFYESGVPIVSSLLREMAAPYGVRRVVRVPVTTLDEYAQTSGVSRVDLVKLDIEGSELAAIRGARRVLTGVRLLFVELHPPHSMFADAARELSVSGLACVWPAAPPDPARRVNCVFARR